MSAAGRALSRPELRTFQANGGVNTDLVDAAFRLARKSRRAGDLFRPGVRFNLHDTMFFEPTAIKQSADLFRNRASPGFFVAESAGKTIVNVPFGDQNSTNAKNGSPLTDAK
ncbi:hypothetical protein [Rhizobium leguminosarum]|uniref:hypothetical protein n=1 Tax=Rhizobium leguminosarum TaxID=384 RepID=UPI001C921D16|nr:hypothetical protein [Rhizobium leguminosarum]MBY2922814.1 hypothetical protein [Rhizobium leguminosarum]MBY3020942.1 hypothetical protein [Rhizobium leguminosarum]